MVCINILFEEDDEVEERQEEKEKEEKEYFKNLIKHLNLTTVK